MKSTNNNIPFKATLPGEVLKDELDARGINQKDFAVEIGIQKTMLNEIIKGKRPITADLAVLLEKSLDISAEYWMRFQTQYEIDVARIKEKNIQRIANIEWWSIIKELIPVSYFKKLGYYCDDLSENISITKLVYNINSIDELVTLNAERKFSLFRKSDKLQIDERNVLAWNVVAKYESQKQVVDTFKLENIPNLIQELNTIFYKNNDVLNLVTTALNKYGIKFVLVPKLDKTPIDGYTFWSGNNPTIALTLRHNRIDNLAFTLMHEIGHIQLHLQKDKEQQFFDLNTKDSHLDVLEQEADSYAQVNLIPTHLWNSFKVDKRDIDNSVLEFSNKNKLNPAIVLGRVSFELKKYNIQTSISKTLN